MSKKSLVALAHGLDVQENVTRVFDMMGGAAKMIEPNSTVVLKPNAGHAAPPEFAVCTHPETALRPAASPPSPGRRASSWWTSRRTRISSM